MYFSKFLFVQFIFAKSSMTKVISKIINCIVRPKKFISANAHFSFVLHKLHSSLNGQFLPSEISVLRIKLLSRKFIKDYVYFYSAKYAILHHFDLELGRRSATTPNVRDQTFEFWYNLNLLFKISILHSWYNCVLSNSKPKFTNFSYFWRALLARSKLLSCYLNGCNKHKYDVRAVGYRKHQERELATVGGRCRLFLISLPGRVISLY